MSNPASFTPTPCDPPLYTDADRLSWVSEGQRVIAPYGDPTKGGGIRCVVEKALGTLAVVVNKNHNFRRLTDVTELFPDDGRIDE